MAPINSVPEHPLFMPLPRFLLGLAVLLGFACLFWEYSDAVRREWDFSVYYMAARAAASGENPYLPSRLLEMAKGIEGVGYGGLPYLYSPLLARLLYPLTLVSYFTASFLWLVWKCIALELAICLTIRLIRAHLSWAWLLALHVLALIFRPIAIDFNAGNVAVFEAALVLLFLYAWSQKKYFPASLFLWLCALLKGSPLLLALYPAHLRNKRFLKQFLIVGILVSLSVILDYPMFLNWREYFQTSDWALLWDEQIQSYYNCSSTTVILRTFTETYFADPIFHAPFLIPIFVPLFPTFVFLLMGYGIYRYQKRLSFDPAHPAVLSLLVCGVLLIPPRLAGYTLTWLFFPLVLCLSWSFYRRNLASFVFSLVGFALLQLDLAPEHIEPGISQLLIDKDFFGLLLLFVSSYLLVLREP